MDATTIRQVKSEKIMSIPAASHWFRHSCTEALRQILPRSLRRAISQKLMADTEGPDRDGEMALRPYGDGGGAAHRAAADTRMELAGSLDRHCIDASRCPSRPGACHAGPDRTGRVTVDLMCAAAVTADAASRLQSLPVPHQTAPP